MHTAPPERDRTAHDAVDTEHLKCCTGTHDVDDRIERVEGRKDPVANAGGEIASEQEIADHAVGTMPMSIPAFTFMFMFMFMSGLVSVSVFVFVGVHHDDGVSGWTPQRSTGSKVSA